MILIELLNYFWLICNINLIKYLNIIYMGVLSGSIHSNKTRKKYLYYASTISKIGLGIIFAFKIIN